MRDGEDVTRRERERCNSGSCHRLAAPGRYLCHYHLKTLVGALEPQATHRRRPTYGDFAAASHAERDERPDNNRGWGSEFLAGDDGDG